MLEATISISSPKEDDQVPTALPAVGASQVAPAAVFISCEASSRTLNFFPPTSSSPSLTTVALPSAFVPTGSLTIAPSFSTAVPSALRTPLVRAIESL